MRDQDILEALKTVADHVPVRDVNPTTQLARAKRARRRSLVDRTVGVLAVVAVAAGSGWAVLDGLRGSTPPPASSGDPSTGGSPLSIVEAQLLSDVQLLLNVSSCNGDPSVETLESTETEVRVLVATHAEPNTLECLDPVEVTLDAPLASRRLIDLSSGEPVTVAPLRVEPDPATP